MAEKQRTRRRMTKREYNTHIFAKARGSKSPVQDVANMHYSGHWWQAPGLGAERGLAEEYEQDAIVNGRDGGEQQWFSSDASDREDFRNKQLEKLRSDFRKSLRSHPEFKDRSAKELTEIADAYLGGKDHDSFKSDAVKSALQEVSDYVTGDGEVAMSDERTWRAKYPGQKSDGTVDNGTSDTGGAGGTGGASTPQNGSPQAPASPNGSSGSVLTPRPPVAGTVPGVTTASGNVPRPDPGSTRTTVNGIPVASNSAASDGLQQNATIAVQTANIAASDAYRDARQASELRERSRYLDKAEEQLNQDERSRGLKNRREAMRAEAEAARRDKRYKNLTLVNKDDWENLGREGSNKLDYSLAENKTAADARQEKIDKLKARFEAYTGEGGVISKFGKDRLVGPGDTVKSYGNDTADYNAGRLNDIKRLSELVLGAIDGKTITDAQIDAATKKFDSWDNETARRKAEADGRKKIRELEQVGSLRRQYGLGSAFSNEDVLEYHKANQKADRKSILGGMNYSPAESDSADNMDSLAENWKKLLDAGLDPEATFTKSMQNQANKDAFLAANTRLMKEAGPDIEDKRDQLRRRFILQQAREDAGLGGILDAERNASREAIVNTPLPGKDSLTSGDQLLDKQLAEFDDVLPGAQPREGGSSANAPGVAGDQPVQPQNPPATAAGAALKDTIPARPRKNAQALAWGGDVLVPRPRRA